MTEKLTDAQIYEQARKRVKEKKDFLYTSLSMQWLTLYWSSYGV
jgi:hypothetical protein